VIIAFGALTLFLSTSVLLDLFGIRERESPYVPAVVVANLIASLLYLPAGARPADEASLDSPAARDGRCSAARGRRVPCPAHRGGW
jgi:hypothetical protein